MPAAIVDTPTLTRIINQCFANASDGRYNDDEQNRFLIEGKRLRGQLLNLLSAQFDEISVALAAANADLAATNADMLDMAHALANAARILNDITALVANLDKLLNVATSFV